MTGNATQNPLVSIVLPTYKRAHLLPDAIRNILDQAYTNFELIIVDDNSPDNTQEVVASFTDPRLRYVRNEPNLKLPRALNRGFSLAQGEFVTWTSDDNLFAPTAIQRMVDELNTGECQLVYADYYLFEHLAPDGTPSVIKHVKLPDQMQLEKGNHIGACFMYTRRVYEAIGEYDPELFLVEDYDYFIRIAKRFAVNHISAPLYYFRRDDDTLYCSRFREVKAADALVRYKNGLINEADVVELLLALLVSNTSGLKNPVLRWSSRVIRKISFRLTTAHQRALTAYLRRRLTNRVHTIMQDYGSNKQTFGEAQATLIALVGELGLIEYQQAQSE